MERAIASPLAVKPTCSIRALLSCVVVRECDGGGSEGRCSARRSCTVEGMGGVRQLTSTGVVPVLERRASMYSHLDGGPMLGARNPIVHVVGADFDGPVGQHESCGGVPH